MEVSNYLGDVQPNYTGVIIHLLSIMDIPVPCDFEDSGGPNSSSFRMGQYD